MKTRHRSRTLYIGQIYKYQEKYFMLRSQINIASDFNLAHTEIDETFGKIGTL